MTATLVSWLKVLGDERHLLILAPGYRSMIPNYMSNKDGVAFKITTSHARGEFTVDSIKKVVNDMSLDVAVKAMFDRVEMVDMTKTSNIINSHGLSFEHKDQDQVIVISLLDCNNREVLDTVEASYVDELMPDQVSRLVSRIEHLNKPAEEKQVTVVAFYIKQEDGQILSLFKYLSGQLDNDECPELSNATGAVRTIHLTNNTIFDQITVHCEQKFFTTLDTSMALKWRDESLYFVVTCLQPQDILRK